MDHELHEAALLDTPTGKLVETCVAFTAEESKLNMFHHSGTWSSSGSSPKAGIYLAHSTSTSNCCLIESQTSPTKADFCSDTSAIPTGDVIYAEEKEEKQ